MLRIGLGTVGLLLGFALGKTALALADVSEALGLLLLLLAWPVLCGVGLIAGANLGSFLDRLLSARAQQPRAADRRGGLVRGEGLLQSGLSLATVVALTWVFPSPEGPHQLTRLPAARACVVLVATAAWCLLLKGWFELLTGVPLRELPSFWRGLSLGGKVLWGGAYYGLGAPVWLAPALVLGRLLTAL